MAWFRCPSCGYIAEIKPVAGELVSVYHPHAHTGEDVAERLSRMEPLPDPVPEPVLAAAGPSRR